MNGTTTTTTTTMNGHSNGHANNGHANGVNGEHAASSKTAAALGLEGELLTERLTLEDMEALADCYILKDRSVKVDPLRVVVRDRMLPKVAKRMGWTEASCRKLRANDVQSVTIRYNSDFHRDRHLYGQAESQGPAMKKAAWTNLSAVVYLDRSSFEYVTDSSWANPKSPEIVVNTFEGGTMILFPSSLVHKARPLLDGGDTSRRTLIMFDIEEVSPAAPASIPHAIVCMPAIFQRPAAHMFLQEAQIQQFIFRMLFSGSMYPWRFMPNWCRKQPVTRVHWQITTPKDVDGDKENKVVALNASIYMPKKDKPTSEIYFYDYRNMVGYLLRLLDAYTFGFFFTR